MKFNQKRNILIKYLFVFFLLAESVMASQQTVGINHFSSADSIFSNGKFQSALNAYQNIPTTNLTVDEQTHLQYKMAECHFNLGHKQEAIDFYRKAFSLGGADKLKAGTRLIRLLAVDGQYEEAFSKARELFHQHPEDSLTLKACAYGNYSAWMLSKKRTLTASELIDQTLMGSAFEKKYAASITKTYIKKH